MAKQKYAWKRFWCPRNGEFSLSDGGYLFDPESEHGKYVNPNLVTFEQISSMPCLALLGEPGIGKSVALETEFQDLENITTPRAELILRFDLRSFQSEDRLIREVFQNEKLQQWRQGNERLHLFLDSLDECLLRIETVAAFLGDELRKLPTDRMLFRIACRTANWPNLLEESLSDIFGSKQVAVVELVPLRRSDVVEACLKNHLRVEPFLYEVEAKHAVPFAIKPITLQFLINSYGKYGNLPTSQVDLYYEGCRILSEERSESRIASRRTGDLSGDQRVMVAGRIAAAMIFGNKYAVWTLPDTGDIPTVDVPLRFLQGGTEIVNGLEFPVTAETISEVLETGLFSSRGQSRLGWAHQTYSEYLAARYLLQKSLGTDQIMDLIVHPDDRSRRLVPQLHETAGWLASMDSEIAERILKRDPEVLLRSDVQKLAAKAPLVDAIMRLSDEGDFSVRDFGQQELSKLSHPGLIEQLRVVIFDRDRQSVTHRLAINIARACNISELQDELADVALDQTREIFVRNSAAHALAEIGNPATRLKLKPLAGGLAGDDPDDELKGAALHALWPDFITVQELFALLTPAKNDHFLGSYYAFLTRKVTRHLRDSDLLEALNRMDDLERVGISYRKYQELGEEILKKAWALLHLPGVAEAFAKIAVRRLRDGDSIIEVGLNREFAEEISRDSEKRRLLLRIIVNGDSTTDDVLLWLTHQNPALAQTSDLIWMIEQLMSDRDETKKKRWIELISRVFDYKSLEQRDALLVACRTELLLNDAFRDWFDAVELGSERAQKMKDAYAERQKWEARRNRQPPMDPSPELRVRKALEDFEAGDIEAWWKLNVEMTLDPESRMYIPQTEFEPDLTVLYGWKSADLETRERMVAAAKKYVLEKDPLPEQWLGKSTLNRPAFAGYRALLLLSRQSPEFLSSLPDEVWRLWAPVILGYPLATLNDDQEEPHAQLAKMGYGRAPEEVLRTLVILIEEESTKYDSISIIRRVKYCWDERLGNAILELAKKESLKAGAVGTLLEQLLERNILGAREFAEVLVGRHSSGEERDISFAVRAAVALALHAEDSGWQAVWPAIQNNSPLAESTISIIAQRIQFSGRLNLTEQQIGELYIFLVRKYPITGDDQNKKEDWVTPRGHIAELRDGLLRYLKNLGTAAACRTIEDIFREFPEMDWLKYSLSEAERNTRLKTWKPSSPQEIITMCTTKDKRIIQSGDHLLQVVNESLERLQGKLQGETPMAQFLWNDQKSEGFSPKEENALSDFVKQHLEDDLRGRGIIVNREVQIRRRIGAAGSPGETTDIHVDSAPKNTNNGNILDVVKVIIEVKGCWNKDLDSAMETQLVSRYLKDNDCKHGIYLVGWFHCPQWSSEDQGRRHPARHTSMEELQYNLDQKAAEQSQSEKGIRILAFTLNCALR